VALSTILYFDQQTHQIGCPEPIMSQSVDAQGWDRFKNVIRGLYMIKGHKLEGPEGVIKIMETQHGFKKS